MSILPFDLMPVDAPSTISTNTKLVNSRFTRCLIMMIGISAAVVLHSHAPWVYRPIDQNGWPFIYVSGLVNMVLRHSNTHSLRKG